MVRAIFTELQKNPRRSKNWNFTTVGRKHSPELTGKGLATCAPSQSGKSFCNFRNESKTNWLGGSDSNPIESCEGRRRSQRLTTNIVAGGTETPSYFYF